MADHTYKFNVTMSCGGCSGAVDRVLKRLEGVKSYEVSLESQSATVVADPALSYETVLRTISKTGKKVNSGEVDGESRSIELPAE
ncbi:Cytosolic copper metallochaperone [Sporothrix eucalyptigena]|uniref:Cytosolic copper metallochaperone n=1 Tax=Sporothrix eucalyptigena TaxID=1812306 RepID=A0ABP0C152_9PEZI